MHFIPTLEQGMLRDSARQFLQAEYDFDRRRTRLSTGSGEPSRSMWSSFAELGWLGLGIPEQMGGFGGGLVEQAILAEACGRALVTDPFVGSAVLPSRVVVASGSAHHQADLLPGVVDGSLQLALAWQEAAGRYEREPVETRARRHADGYVLDGRKILVLGGHACDQIIVSARLLGDDGGTALFVVRADAAGLLRSGYSLMDHQWAADLAFDGVQLPAEALLVSPGPAQEVLDEALDHACVTLCAMLVGGMDCAIELAVNYMQQRQQFGQPLAAFQVQQHRSAQMFIDADSARSMVLAAMTAMAAPAVLRRRAVSAAKHKVAEVAKVVTGEAIHQHGGMGMTLEYSVGHYLRAAMVADKLFGDADFHMQRYLALEQDAAGLADLHWEWA